MTDKTHFFFGRPWSGISAHLTQGDTPVGDPCHYCTMAMVEGDQGAWLYRAFDGKYEPIHRECMIRMLSPSLAALELRDTEDDLSTPEQIRAEALGVWRFMTRERVQ